MQHADNKKRAFKLHTTDFTYDFENTVSMNFSHPIFKKYFMQNDIQLFHIQYRYFNNNTFNFVLNDFQQLVFQHCTATTSTQQI